MYYNIIMEKKSWQSYNNIHHCYNLTQHAQAKASCKGRRQQKPKRQKQSWVIDKTKLKNTNADISAFSIIPYIVIATLSIVIISIFDIITFIIILLIVLPVLWMVITIMSCFQNKDNK